MIGHALHEVERWREAPVVDLAASAEVVAQASSSRIEVCKVPGETVAIGVEDGIGATRIGILEVVDEGHHACMAIAHHVAGGGLALRVVLQGRHAVVVAVVVGIGDGLAELCSTDASGHLHGAGIAHHVEGLRPWVGISAHLALRGVPCQRVQACGLVACEDHVAGLGCVGANPGFCPVALSCLAIGGELHYHLLAACALGIEHGSLPLSGSPLARDGLLLVVVHGDAVADVASKLLAIDGGGGQGEVHDAGRPLRCEVHQHVGEGGGSVTVGLVEHMQTGVLLGLGQIGDEGGLARGHVDLAQAAHHLLGFLVDLGGHHVEAVGGAVEGHALEDGIEIEVEGADVCQVACGLVYAAEATVLGHAIHLALAVDGEHHAERVGG